MTPPATQPKSTGSTFSSFILKALELALIADQAYEETQAPGASASTVLQPNNFNNLLLELASVFAPKPAA